MGTLHSEMTDDYAGKLYKEFAYKLYKQLFKVAIHTPENEDGTVLISKKDSDDSLALLNDFDSYFDTNFN